MGISNLTGKRVKNVKDSLVSDQLLQCDCTIAFYYLDISASDTSDSLSKRVCKLSVTS